MHLLIPFASSCDPGCLDIQRTLKLPNLERLLTLFPTLYLDEGSETSFSPPHERAHARALTGIDKPPRLDDGRFPWATWYVLQQNEIFDRSGAWAFITPCHWDVEADNIRMTDPATLDISAADSKVLLEAMQPYFAGDNITLRYDTPGRWLATGDIFRGLPTAALDRVIGQPISSWMPEATKAKALRRLQNEMQMLLYTHPVNDQRTARGQAEINSFWISGTGRESALIGAPLHSSFDSTFDTEEESQYVSAAPESHWHDFMPGQTDRPPTLKALTVYIPQALRDAALRQDWASWAQAWQHIDETYCAKLLRSALDAGSPTPSSPLPQLTLCGERNAVTYQAIPQSALGRLTKRISSRFARTPLHSILGSL